MIMFEMFLCVYSQQAGVKSNAPESVRSPVLNLQEAEPCLTQQSIFQAITKQFYANNPPYYKEEVSMKHRSQPPILKNEKH